jgi:hypothetical protein
LFNNIFIKESANIHHFGGIAGAVPQFLSILTLIRPEMRWSANGGKMQL